MAASPIAALPVIRTLLTVDLYGDLGADQRANGAAGAFPAVVEHGRQVPAGVQLVRLGYGLPGTEVHADLAPFAQLAIYLDVALCLAFSLQSRSPPILRPGVYSVFASPPQAGEAIARYCDIDAIGAIASSPSLRSGSELFAMTCLYRAPLRAEATAGWVQ